MTKPPIPRPRPRGAPLQPGERFGRLTVVALAKPGGPGFASSWLCRCDCGGEKVVFKNNLVNGYTTSCGCFHREQTIKSNTRHGHARRIGEGKTPEWRCWIKIIERCYDLPETHRSYRYYQGAGVAVCDRWRFGENGLSGFQCFLADMGKRPNSQTFHRSLARSLW